MAAPICNRAEHAMICDNSRMRLITHTCSNTEIVCALGCEQLLVGVDDHSDYPADVVSRIPKIGPDLDFDIERVLALEPDLVITSLTVPGHERNIEQLEKHQVPHHVMQPFTLTDVADNFRTIAALLDVPAQGEKLASDFNAAMTPSSPSQDNYREPAVLIEWWPKPVIVPGRKSWVTPMLSLAGGRNPLADEEIESRPLTEEELTAINPDAIIISWCGVPFEKYRHEVVYRRPYLQDCPALTNQRVYSVSEAFLGRPGPRLVEGLEKLRAIVADCE